MNRIVSMLGGLVLVILTMPGAAEAQFDCGEYCNPALSRCSQYCEILGHPATCFDVGSCTYECWDLCTSGTGCWQYCVDQGIGGTCGGFGYPCDGGLASARQSNATQSIAKESSTSSDAQCVVRREAPSDDATGQTRRSM